MSPLCYYSIALNFDLLLVEKMITIVLTRLLRQGHCYIGKSKESNPTDALANTPPTHCQHVNHHFENKILVPKSSPHFFLLF